MMDGDIVTGDINRDTAWVGKTPGGALYFMTVRPGTSDWNTAQACSGGHDEYRLPRGLTGWALDVGAHIGAATVPLLLDNPELRVVAIEALPENAELLKRNLERNDVCDRAIVLQGAATDDGLPVRIRYTPEDPVHQFIGNSNPGESYVEAVGVTLGVAMAVRHQMGGPGQIDEPFAWAKIDCEGCEYRFLVSPMVSALRYITGEVHFGYQRLVELLEATHLVSGPGQDFGPFEAVLRGSGGTR